MKTTKIEENVGPASIIIVNGEKDIQVVCGTIIGGKDILENPLGFPTKAQVHTCEYDGKKGISRRRYDGKIESANFEIMTEVRNKREEQGRAINEVPKMPEITGDFEGEISENGEIVRETAGSER